MQQLLVLLINLTLIGIAVIFGSFLLFGLLSVGLGVFAYLYIRRLFMNNDASLQDEIPIQTYDEPGKVIEAEYQEIER